MMQLITTLRRHLTYDKKTKLCWDLFICLFVWKSTSWENKDLFHDVNFSCLIIIRKQTNYCQNECSGRKGPNTLYWWHHQSESASFMASLPWQHVVRWTKCVLQTWNTLPIEKHELRADYQPEEQHSKSPNTPEGPHTQQPSLLRRRRDHESKQVW